MLSRSKTYSIQGNPTGAILSESDGNMGSVQRLTAETERLRSGYGESCKYGRTKHQHIGGIMKICPKCKKEYEPTGKAQLYCAICGLEHKKLKAKEYHKTHYKRRGYNQLGENNNNWTGGIGTYRAKPKTECERCGARKTLLWHHKDRNRYNNSQDNLECLCKRCHQIEHKCWDVLPKGKELSKISKKVKRKRNDQGKFC